MARHRPLILWLCALVTACGGRSGKSESSGGASTGSDEDTAGAATTVTSEGDDGATQWQCDANNYLDELSGYTELGCFPAREDGVCPVCDQACMEAIVDHCPLEGCGDHPDALCLDGCANHRLLCNELRDDECCYLVTASYGGPIP